MPVAGYGSEDTEGSTNDSDEDSITSTMAAQLALSEDPQLDERMMRLNSGVDNNGRLQKSLDDHIYKVQRDPEAARAEAKRCRSAWAMRARHKLTRKDFFAVIDQDDIPPPPQFDKSIDGVFVGKHDEYRSKGERLHSWAICDPAKKRRTEYTDALARASPWLLKQVRR